MVLRARRLPRPEPEWLAIRPVERSTVQYRDQVATGRSPTGNGIARAHCPPAGTD
ncbi:MAG: hypothetical protein H0V41_06360 [Pseudonocardiales bacterium]|nr:hypothetical protein [Pseudonocardiales bacterium]